MRHFFTTLVLLAALATPAHALADETIVTGRILGANGRALPNAFIQQQGGSASTTTDDQGFYTLKLDASGGARLLVTAIGYLSQEVPVSNSVTLTLRPVPTYRPSFVPVPPEAGTTPTQRRFDTQIGVQYRLRSESLSYTSATGQVRKVSGWASNEVGGLARYRVNDLVFSLDGWRNKVPLTLANLQPAPTAAVDTSAWSVALGYVVALGALEVMPEVAYANSFVTPSMSGTPYTGTPLDFTTTRQGIALGVEAGYPWGGLEVQGEFRIVPAFLTSSSLTGAPYTPQTPTWGEGGLVVGYQVIPGLRVEGSYTYQFAGASDLSEGAHVFGLGLTYHPERIAP